MNGAGNETLDRIQQEIREVLEREEELKTKYASLNGTGPDCDVKNVKNRPAETNGTAGKSNGFRRFMPNPSARGVMHKFLKMRGKFNPVLKTAPDPNPQPAAVWPTHDFLEPAKITVEAGKPARNGFVPAEVKMKKELQEFQQREEELRKERRKSQPDLMKALEAEYELECSLKSTKSTALLYSCEDLTEDTHYTNGKLKAARSLAELCDVDDDHVEIPGTHSLIMQFENMKSKDKDYD